MHFAANSAVNAQLQSRFYIANIPHICTIMYIYNNKVVFFRLEEYLAGSHSYPNEETSHFDQSPAGEETT